MTSNPKGLSTTPALTELQLAQHGANADENQVSDCNYYGKLNNQHRDAEENLDYAQGDAGSG